MTETNYEAATRLLAEADNRELTPARRDPLLALASVFGNLAVADAMRGEPAVTEAPATRPLVALDGAEPTVAGEWELGVPEGVTAITVRLLDTGKIQVLSTDPGTEHVTLFEGFDLATISTPDLAEAVEVFYEGSGMARALGLSSRDEIAYALALVFDDLDAIDELQKYAAAITPEQVGAQVLTDALLADEPLSPRRKPGKPGKSDAHVATLKGGDGSKTRYFCRCAAGGDHIGPANPRYMDASPIPDDVKVEAKPIPTLADLPADASEVDRLRAQAALPADEGFDIEADGGEDDEDDDENDEDPDDDFAQVEAPKATGKPAEPTDDELVAAITKPAKKGSKK